MRNKILNLVYILILAFLLSACGLSSSKIAEGGNITSMEDLKDKRIAILTGSAGDNASRRRFPNAQFFNMNNIVDASAALDSNRVDAVVFERTALQKIAQQNPGFALLDESVQLLDVAIAVKKNRPELLNSINKVIAELKSNGTLSDMGKRWFAEGDLPAMPKLNYPSDKGNLRVGVELLMPPFAFVTGYNEPSGLDMELAERIGQAMGKKVVVDNMNFNSLIPALQSEKIDISISCFNVTEERKKEVDFSIPYHISDTAAMIKKSQGVPQTENIISSVKNSFYNNIVVERRYMLILDGLKATVEISLLSLVLGTLIGSLVCMMRMSRKRILKTIAQAYISILRGTPVLVLLMLLFYVAFASINIDPVIVAAIAFSMNFSAYTSEMFRTSIESIDKGQWEAGLAGGFTSLQTFAYIILPQAVRRVLPVFKGEFISLVKLTSIVGYIAVQDLTKASDIIRSRTFDAFFPLVLVALLYFVISWLLGLILDYIGIMNNPKRNNKRAVKV